MTRAESNEFIIELLLEAFPDETAQTQQRIRKEQAALLNLAIMIAKYERKPS